MTQKDPELEDFGFRMLTKKEKRARDRHHAKQRREWDFCDADLWDFDTHITEFLLPRLVRYKKMPRCGHPCRLTEKRWEEILDQIITAFRIIHKYEISLENVHSVKKGLALFAKYYLDLWD